MFVLASDTFGAARMREYRNVEGLVSELDGVQPHSLTGVT